MNDTSQKKGSSDRRPPRQDDFSDAPRTLVLTYATTSPAQRKSMQIAVNKAVTLLDSTDEAKWKTTSLADVHQAFWDTAKGLTDDADTVLGKLDYAGTVQHIIPVATRSLTPIPLAGNISAAEGLLAVPDETFPGNSYNFYDLSSVGAGDGIFRYIVKDHEDYRIMLVLLFRPAPTAEAPDRWLKKKITWRMQKRAPKRA